MSAGNKINCELCGGEYNEGTDLSRFGCACLKAKINAAKASIAAFNNEKPTAPADGGDLGGKVQCEDCWQFYQKGVNMAEFGCACAKAQAAAIKEARSAASTPAEEEKKVEPKESKPVSDEDLERSNYLAPKWHNAKNCENCNYEFGLFGRRHHCRNCGNSLCSDHMAKAPMDIPRFNMVKVPVCPPCAEQLKSKPNWAQKPELLVTPESKEEYHTTKPDGEVSILRSAKGLASREPRTVIEVFETAVKNKSSTPAIKVFRDAAWKSWSWKEYLDECKQAAKAMIHLGMKPFESVAILGFNSPEWFFSNNGAILAGGKAAGIYATNKPDACHYICEHSEASIVVVENKMQLDKILAVRSRLPKCKAIVVYEPGFTVPEDANVDGQAPVYTWSQFTEFGKGEGLDDELQKRMAAQKPGNCCTLIYTSGTTGNPKAVMISHDNCTWTSNALLSIIPKFGGDGPEGPGESVVSYLPLSHIAAQMVDIHAPMAVAARSAANSTVWFAQPDALKGTLTKTFQAAQPTLVFAVPRVWEKFTEAMKAAGAKSTGLKKMISTWAKNTGAQSFQASEVGAKDRSKSLFAGLAGKLVFSKVKATLGLTRAKYLFTGAAPIMPQTINYLGSLNLEICELYGMSENSGPQCVCVPEFRKTGSCGRPMPGCELKIVHDPSRDKPGEGEICMRGRHVMMGYMKNPEKTREAIDEEGYLHSGDVGRVDDQGLLYITGRIKELIIGAGGENIAPVPIEEGVQLQLPGISKMMMVGDKRKYNVALITLKQKDDGLGGYTSELVGDSKLVNPEVTTVEGAQKDPVWQKYIEDGIKAVNDKAVSRAAKVQKFRILPSEFSVPGGELTGTLKLRRAIVVEKYHDLIEEMYNEKPAAKAEAKPAEKKQEAAEEAK